MVNLPAISETLSAQAASAHFVPAGQPAGRKPAVLLVEDDPDVSAIMSLLLSDCGFSVSTACSGQEGLHLAQILAPDIAVLDVNLPGLNGLEVCRRLKADPETRAMPVVFCSGERQHAEEALRLGAAAFLVKPDGILKLADCLREILDPCPLEIRGA